MAVIRATVTTDPQWTPDDKLRLYAGDENASSLAASNPSGGTQIAERSALDDLNQPQTVIEARFEPTDKCALLPIGVTVVDQAGNETTVFESFVQLDDTPEGVAPGSPQSTGVPGEALIDWDASGDVT